MFERISIWLSYDFVLAMLAMFVVEMLFTIFEQWNVQPDNEKHPMEGKAENGTSVNELNSNVQQAFNSLKEPISGQKQTTALQAQSLRSLRDKISAQQGKISALQGIITTKQERIGTLTSTITVQEGTISTMEDIIASKDQTISSQEGTISSKERTIATQEETIDSLKQTIISKEEAVMSKEETINLLEKIIASKDEHITSQEETIKILEESNHGKLAEIVVLNHSIDGLKAIVKVKSNDTMLWKNAKEHLEEKTYSEIQELKKKIESMEAEAQGHLASISMKDNALRLIVASFKRRYTAKEQENHDLQAQIDFKAKELHQFTQAKETLQQDLDTANALAAHMHQTLTACKQKLTTAKTTLSNSMAYSYNLLAYTNDLESAIQAWRRNSAATFRALQARIAELEDVSATATTSDALRDEKIRLERENEMLKRDLKGVLEMNERLQGIVAGKSRWEREGEEEKEMMKDGWGARSSSSSSCTSTPASASLNASHSAREISCATPSSSEAGSCSIVLGERGEQHQQQEQRDEHEARKEGINHGDDDEDEKDHTDKSHSTSSSWPIEDEYFPLQRCARLDSFRIVHSYASSSFSSSPRASSSVCSSRYSVLMQSSAPVSISVPGSASEDGSHGVVSLSGSEEEEVIVEDEEYEEEE